MPAGVAAPVIKAGDSFIVTSPHSRLTGSGADTKDYMLPHAIVSDGARACGADGRAACGARA